MSMEKELLNTFDKELLLKDLCARLPYGIKFLRESWNFETDQEMSVIEVLEDIDKDGYINNTKVYKVEDIKPYLFPLSSMTDKQAKEMQEIIGNPNYACIMRKTGGLELWLESVDTDPTIWLDTIFEVQDWLNKNHFDYRNLIDKNLAIDCTNLNIY